MPKPPSEAPVAAAGVGEWRNTVLPPQVRQRIARLREMPETDDRKLLRWETNRLLLDRLVPSVGVACYVVPASVPLEWFATGRADTWTPTKGDPWDVVTGKDQLGQPFEGVSLWCGHDEQRVCVMAATISGECTYRLPEPKPAK